MGVEMWVLDLPFNTHKDDYAQGWIWLRCIKTREGKIKDCWFLGVRGYNNIGESKLWQTITFSSHQ